MFVETVWHAHRQTFLSLFAANSGTQRPMSVLCSEWHSSCPGGQEPGEPTTAQAQLVAEGVAAFNKNIESVYGCGWTPSLSMLVHYFLGGSFPSGHVWHRYGRHIFKIPITQTLANSHSPWDSPVARPAPAHHRSEGMKPLDNRCKIVRCYDMFKTIVGI